MRALIFTGLVFLLAFSTALGQDSSPKRHLERAQICFDALDYECASQELSRARAYERMLSLDDRIKLYELGALSALSHGKQGEAEEELRKLLMALPNFEPKEGSWPPNWLNVLERVRRGMPDRRAPRIVDPGKLATAFVGHPWSVRFEVLDSGGVAAVSLFVYVEEEVKRLSLATSDGQFWKARVPGEWLQGEELRYWVEAFDRAGNGPGRLGSIDQPHQLELRKKPIDEARPLYQKWWFWTALGTAIVAGGTTLYLMSGSADPEVPIPTGNMNVEIEWPSP